jgi:hypothetical protein
VVPAETLANQRKAVEANWEHWQSHDSEVQIRPEVEESWQRSASSVSLEVDSAPTRSGFDVETEWDNHALNAPVISIEPELRQIAEDGGFIVAIWKHTELTLDVVPGRGSGFSVEAPEGVRFLIRSRVFTDAEWEVLKDQFVPTGSQHE